MAFIGSSLFLIVFYPFTLIYAVVLSPCLITRTTTRWVVLVWAYITRLLVRLLLGIGHRITYKADTLPEQAIYASKHQSSWETMLFWLLIPNPVFVIKRELFNIPVVGWYIRRSGCIGLDRSAGAASVKKLIKEAKLRTSQGYNIIIYPEGTRVAVGKEAELLPGVTALYKQLKLPVIPVALDSGLYWPRNSFLKRAGTIRMVVLPALEQGLDNKGFLARLQSEIQTNSLKLLQDDPYHEPDAK